MTKQQMKDAYADDPVTCFVGVGSTFDQAVAAAASRAELRENGQVFAVQQIHVKLINDPVIDEYRITLGPLGGV